MEITEEQDEHKIDHGKVKAKEDIDVTAIDKSKKDFKIKRLSRINFTELIITLQCVRSVCITSIEIVSSEHNFS